MALGLLAVVAWGLVICASGHAADLPGPTLSDCGRPGERVEVCTADQQRWEDRIDLLVVVAVGLVVATALSAIGEIGSRLMGHHRGR